MNSKQRNKLIPLLLGVSLVPAFACVKGPSTGARCGTSSPATPPNCVQVTCSTFAEVCNGAPNAYYCNVIPYSATCATVHYTLMTGGPEGQQFCGGTPVVGGGVGAACTTTESVTGC
jgi:hypothetical protein